jgi:hypothetical protein
VRVCGFKLSASESKKVSGTISGGSGEGRQFNLPLIQQVAGAVAPAA